MKKSIAIRGNTIHIQTTRDKKRVRFSAGLKGTKENIDFVLKNYEDLINEHLEAQERKKALQDKKRKVEKTTIQHYLNRILKMSQELKINTQMTYSNYSNVLLEFFGQMEIKKIDRECIEDFYLYLSKKDISKRRAKAIISFLKRVFDLALHDEVILKNPIFTYKFSSLKDQKEINPFSLQEVQMLLKESKRDIYPRYFYNLLCVAFFSGMRSGELFALKAENLDFVRKKIKITASINLKGLENPPKTRSSLREIDMLPPVKEALENQLQKQSGKYLFSGDKPFKSSTHFKEHWKALLENCNLEYRVFYNTRHTFASIMMSAGEEQMWVCKMLGHENLGITLKHYARFIEDTQKQRATFLNNVDF